MLSQAGPIRRPLSPLKLFAPIAVACQLLGLAAAASAHTYTLRPAADTVVKQAFPASNYGSATSLTIRNGATGQTEHSFFRFLVPNLQGNVTSATLTLRVTGPIQEVGYYSVTMGNPTWPETWLTWNNWLAGTTFTFLGSQTNLSSGTNSNLNVTGWLGSSNVTFAAASSADVTGQRFSSKEGGVSPTLTIVTSDLLAACDIQGLKEELKTILTTGNLLYQCD